jgi:hypothetical protein
MGHAIAAPLRNSLRTPIPFPTAYETIIKDRVDRKQVKLLLCDLHLDRASESAFCILTGTIAPAACCDQCQIEQAEALATAPRPDWGRL